MKTKTPRNLNRGITNARSRSPIINEKSREKPPICRKKSPELHSGKRSKEQESKENKKSEGIISKKDENLSDYILKLGEKHLRVGKESKKEKEEEKEHFYSGFSHKACQIDAPSIDLPNMATINNHQSDLTILNNLNHRFKNNKFFTYAGPLLLSFNPGLGNIVSNKQFLPQYRNLYRPEKESLYKLQAHLYSVSLAAYKTMISNDKDQCIALLGSSNSGKSFSLVKLINHLISLSYPITNESDQNICELLNSSIALLQIMGSTYHQDNPFSSSIGMHVEIQYNQKNQAIGSKMIAKILDITLPSNENGRTFQILHSILCAPKTILQGISLHNFVFNSTRLMNNSNFSHDQLEQLNIQDNEMWKKFINCITILEIDKLEIISIFEILSSILHIFNLSIIQKNQLKKIYSTRRGTTVQKICKLLKIQEQKFLKAFTGVSESEVWTKLENLARLLYTNLFNWMVAKINKILEKSTEDYFKHSELHKKYQTIKNIIHVVEFAPFNSTNSIKGLSINIANEALNFYCSQQYINLLLALHDEGIEFEKAEYPISKYLIDFSLDSNHGLIMNLNQNHASFAEYVKSLQETIQRSPLSKFVRLNKSLLEIKFTWGKSCYNLSQLRNSTKNLYVTRSMIELLNDTRHIILTKFNMSKYLKQFAKTITNGKENILENMFAETFSENLSELLKSVMSYVPMLIYCFQSTAQEDFGDSRLIQNPSYKIPVKKTLKEIHDSLILPLLLWEWFGFPEWILLRKFVNDFKKLIEDIDIQGLNHRQIALLLTSKYLRRNTYKIGKNHIILKTESWNKIKSLLIDHNAKSVSKSKKIEKKETVNLSEIIRESISPEYKEIHNYYIYSHLLVSDKSSLSSSASNDSASNSPLCNMDNDPLSSVCSVVTTTSNSSISSKYQSQRDPSISSGPFRSKTPSRVASPRNAYFKPQMQVDSSLKNKQFNGRKCEMKYNSRNQGIRNKAWTEGVKELSFGKEPVFYNIHKEGKENLIALPDSDIMKILQNKLNNKSRRSANVQVFQNISNQNQIQNNYMPTIPTLNQEISFGEDDSFINQFCCGRSDPGSLRKANMKKTEFLREQERIWACLTIQKIWRGVRTRIFVKYYHCIVISAISIIKKHLKAFCMRKRNHSRLVKITFNIWLKSLSYINMKKKKAQKSILLQEDKENLNIPKESKIPSIKSHSKKLSTRSQSIKTRLSRESDSTKSSKNEDYNSETNSYSPIISRQSSLLALKRRENSGIEKNEKIENILLELGKRTQQNIQRIRHNKLQYESIEFASSSQSCKDNSDPTQFLQRQQIYSEIKAKSLEQQRKSKENIMRENCTSSPSINNSSKEIRRSYEDLIKWKNSKDANISNLQEEKENFEEEFCKKAFQYKASERSNKLFKESYERKWKQKQKQNQNMQMKQHHQFVKTKSPMWPLTFIKPNRK